MKKCVALFTALVTVLLFASCKKDPANVLPSEPTDPGVTVKEDQMLLKVTVIEKNGDTLTLADREGGGVYTCFADRVTVFLDGKESDISAVENGMPAEVRCSELMETYPAQFGAETEIYVYSRGSEKNPGGSLYDLAGLYLKVLEDLWEDDDGLNGSADYISVDLSNAPGELSQGEKNAVALIFASRHGAQPLTLGFEELAAEGYINKEELYWEDGLLFTISQTDDGDKTFFGLPRAHFSAQKWRSGLGAIFYNDCEVTWSEMGSWGDYQIGGFAIS